MRPVVIGRLVLVLFLFSGLAGLIYQSIWSQYLGLLLGHAAYAQTLVLSIFMGGMAWGAWLASRWSGNWRRLFRAYAIAELIIGVLGLVFHWLFQGYSFLSTEVLLPAMPGAGAASVAQWVGAALLIAPQSILLGMTFPLMSSAFLRVCPGKDGEVLGGLYFSNSFGAALGALMATFLLVPLLGLPGTVAVAGVVNILVAIVAWFITGDDEQTLASTPVTAAAVEPFSPYTKPLLLATFLSGAASFVYEVTWIRMLNQALGTSIHSFELMLASFIFGLALGGLWVRRYNHRITDPVRVAGWAQVLMGSAALLSLLAFSRSFEWVGWLMGALGRTESGYTLYSLGSATFAIIIMLPAAFFAGMTLPLFTMALLRTSGGERSIGRIYASNTLGAIVGVIVCLHVLIPLLGVRLSLALAALMDMGIGLVLLRMYVETPRRGVVAVGGLVCVLSLFVGLHFGKLDSLIASAGVFRTGNVSLSEDTKLHYYRDGKTATVSLYSQGPSVATIATNGKPDASLALSIELPPTPDEVTMAMLGVMPLVFHSEPKNIAFVGWGSGLSTHTLLGSKVPKHVDTIEIERTMYDAARLFGDRVRRAYEDPRSHLYLDDARKFFALLPGQYDAIVSEPSNPWVSGVANLFTKEFYALSNKALTDEGVFVQWLHTYEITDELVATMISALLDVFPEVRLYVSNYADVLVVGSRKPLQVQSLGWMQEEPLRTELRRVGLGSGNEFALRYIGGRRVLEAFVGANKAGPHSDYFPQVSLRAPKARFARQSSLMLQTLVDSGLPVLEIIDDRPLISTLEEIIIRPESGFSMLLNRALGAQQSMAKGEVLPVMLEIDLNVASALGLLFSLGKNPIPDDALANWSRALDVVARATLGYLSKEQIGDLFFTKQSFGPLDQQSELVKRSLLSVEAIAERNLQGMKVSCRNSLEQDSDRLSDEFKTTLAVCIALAEIGLGEAELAKATLAEFSVLTAADRDLNMVSRFLQAWLAR